MRNDERECDHVVCCVKSHLACLSPGFPDWRRRSELDWAAVSHCLKATAIKAFINFTFRI